MGRAVVPAGLRARGRNSIPICQKLMAGGANRALKAGTVWHELFLNWKETRRIKTSMACQTPTLATRLPAFLRFIKY